MKSPKKYRFHLVLPFALLLLVFIIISLINKPKSKNDQNAARSSIFIKKCDIEKEFMKQADCNLTY